MLFGNDRKQLRKIYFDAWQHAKNGESVTPLEQQIVAVIKIHPEYQTIFLKDIDQQIDKDFANVVGDENPFLHLGLHLGLREQLATNRPNGIRKIFQQYAEKIKQDHEAEHVFMEILAEFIWQAQQQGKNPDETLYLKKLRLLISR